MPDRKRRLQASVSESDESDSDGGMRCEVFSMQMASEMYARWNDLQDHGEEGRGDRSILRPLCAF